MTKQLKVGDLAKVTDWEGKLLDRRVIAIRGNLLYVCTDEELAQSKLEGREPVTVGWPSDAAGL